ncbi:hypothetical protein FXO38_12641 [Capsicum annuum]|nr:hypothetical protein FXO38_12641 [Capsicum annuum]
MPPKNATSSKLSAKKDTIQKPVESEETSKSISWTESSREEYTRTTSKKGAQKVKAQDKSKGKGEVPQYFKTLPPKVPRGKKIIISPPYTPYLKNDEDKADDDEAKSNLAEESEGVPRKSLP